MPTPRDSLQTFLLNLSVWALSFFVFTFARRSVALRRMDALMRRDAPTTEASLDEQAAQEIPAHHLPVLTEYDGLGQVPGAAEAREQFVQRALVAFRTTLAVDALAALGYAWLPALFAIASPTETISSSYTGLVVGSIYLVQALTRYSVYRTQFRAIDSRSRSEKALVGIATFAFMFVPVPVHPETLLRFALAPRLRATFLVSAIGVALLAAADPNGWHDQGLRLAALLQVGLEAWHWRYTQRMRGMRLVVLRVFGLDQNGRFLFDGVLSFWRHFGHFFTVIDPAFWRSGKRRSMVTLPLAGLAVLMLSGQMWGPRGLFLVVVQIPVWVAYAWFVQYRLERGFIRGQEHLRTQLARIDKRPRNLDLTYKSFEAGCYDNTWKLTVAEFVRRSDAVLMDLRGYSPERKGCQFEINFLLDAVRIDHIVFVIDADADRAALRHLMLDCWRDLRATSPNLGLEAPEVRIYVAANKDARDIQGVIDLVIHATGTVAIAPAAGAPVAPKNPRVSVSPLFPYATALGHGIDWFAAAAALLVFLLALLFAAAALMTTFLEALVSLTTVFSSTPRQAPPTTEGWQAQVVEMLVTACVIRFAGRASHYLLSRQRIRPVVIPEPVGSAGS